MKKKPEQPLTNINLIPMIDVTSFILLALAILTMSMKKEASLDNILKLPPVLHASKQDKTMLQIYILPAVVLKGGFVNSDSTGLVAFVGKGGAPLKCPNCGFAFRDANNVYIPNTLLDQKSTPVQTLSIMAEDPNAQMTVKNEQPPAYLCSQCKYEISPYLKLDEIPRALKIKKKEVVDIQVNTENFTRQKNGYPLLSPEEVKKIEDEIPLIIKADDRAFYGRILEVVSMAKDTSCAIKKFAFATLAEASLEAQKKDAKDRGKPKP